MIEDTLSVVPVTQSAMKPPASASGMVAMTSNACVIERNTTYNNRKTSKPETMNAPVSSPASSCCRS
ncbi:MAG TPA: hypothetical protein VFQ92_19250 [Blastocatellia bacterium]|nr:hypothetical protein [Blastocatellia bacterium]